MTANGLPIFHLPAAKWVASLHRCNYPLTWNCRHLANGNKLRHLRKINEGLGLPSPDLVTPLELGVDP